MTLAATFVSSTVVTSSTKRQGTCLVVDVSLRQCDTKAVFTLAILPDACTVRERYASGCPCTQCVHCVGFVRYTEITSGGVLSGRARCASGWRCSVNARVDASGTPATRCVQNDPFLSTPYIFNAANLRCIPQM